MARALMVLGLLLAAGCGEMGDGGMGAIGGQGGNQPQNYGARLVGNWILTQGVAAAALDFKDGQYAVLVGRSDGSAIDAQLENGTYSATADRVTFAPVQWTCAGAPPAPYVNGYSVSPGSLVLTGNDGALAYVPNTSPPGSGVITYGCFDSSGMFTPHPLGPAR